MSDDDIELGAQAVEAGLISVRQLGDALRELFGDPVPDERLWQVLLRRGLLDIEQLNSLQRTVEEGERPPVDARAGYQGPRYLHEKRLGTGGMGQVRQVHDRSLGRSVAMKQLASHRVVDQEASRGLMIEARVAGMLEHPNIIPIYDAGLLPTGEPYYTMRLMDQMSLMDVLALLRGGNPEALREYPLSRLLRIFQQVCLAVDYAHSRGVTHRDIKPDNVRLGRYGEVQLADWGLARMDGLPDLALEKALREAAARGEEDPCIVIGSPNYMAPEQACGLNDQIGPPADIYALGAMLYEILTLDAPFEHADTMVLLDKVEHEELVPPTERAPDRMIPEPLAELCVAALHKDPEQRIGDVRILHRGIEDYLEGARQREVAGGRAFDEVQRGHRFGEAYKRVRAARDAIVRRLEEPVDAIRRRQLERELSALRLQLASYWGEAYDAYTRAVAFTPGDLVARAKLAELAWMRLEDAEAAGDEIGCQFYWNILQRYNDGAWDRVLTGSARLQVRSRPEGATVHLRSYVIPSLDGTDEGRAVGRTPLSMDELEAGLYLVTLEQVGHRSAVRPIFLRAGVQRVLDADLTPLEPGIS